MLLVTEQMKSNVTEAAETCQMVLLCAVELLRRLCSADPVDASTVPNHVSRQRCQLASQRGC